MSTITKRPEATGNQIVLNPQDLTSLRELMDKYGEAKELFFGESDEGETVLISIYPDKVGTITYQNNHWVRENVYYHDGSSEELFRGKWE